LDNTIFFLIGRAGVGKLTTAQAIGAMTGARIIDNHYVNNPIFRLIELYRQEPLPAEVWDRIAEVRHAILETVAALSPPRWSFVFTYVAFEAPEDIAVYRAVRRVAERRGARFQPVRLHCEVEELIRRAGSPERRALLKDTSQQNARLAAGRPLMTLEEPNALDIDTTNVTADEVARLIVTSAAGARP
jgi:predicted kinase